jgi:carboxyl-terminal processing protease
MTIDRRTLISLATGATLGVAISLGTAVFADRQNGGKITLPLEELRTFSEVFGKVKSDYVEEVEDRTLLNNAIRGMLSGLDPHSSYLDQEEFKEMQVGTSGQFGGLGIEVSMEDGFVKVVAPIDDTPAARAGIKSGDLIIRLNDTPVKGMTLNDAVKVMRGHPGTGIDLTIMREGQQQPLQMRIVRDVIRVQSVRSRMLAPGFGYVRITNFQSPTSNNLQRALERLREESNSELKGLVLDLRNNPGGVLGAAVEVTDAFLNKGLIVYTEGRSEDAILRYNATPGDILDGAPLVVLVNNGSASASEIVAGALQDHGRAVIMGNRTFGKGSVQTIFPMSNSTAVKITTARYFTPSGRSIQAAGIEPDIELEAVEVARKESSVKPVTEANLSGHLLNGSKEEPQGESSDEKKGTTESLASQDYPLHEALNLLRGLAILQGRRTAP